MSQMVLGLGDGNKTEEELKSASLWTIIMTNSLAVVGTIFYYFFDGELKRTKMEQIDKFSNKESLVCS